MSAEQLPFSFAAGRRPKREPAGVHSDEMHHLYFDEKRGYELRVTVSVRGSRKVGKRVKVRLRTFDPEEAIGLRGVAFASFRALKLVVADRRITRGAAPQTSTKEAAEASTHDAHDSTRLAKLGHEAQQLAATDNSLPGSQDSGQTAGDPPPHEGSA